MHSCLFCRFILPQQVFLWSNCRKGFGPSYCKGYSERHIISIVPVTRVTMAHHNCSFSFYIIRNGREVYLKDYPARFCWGLCPCFEWLKSEVAVVTPEVLHLLDWNDFQRTDILVFAQNWEDRISSNMLMGYALSEWDIVRIKIFLCSCKNRS